MNGRRPFLNLLQEFSVPLLAGVAVAMLVANLAPDSYAQALHWAPLGERQIFGHRLDLHFLKNELDRQFVAVRHGKDFVMSPPDLKPWKIGIGNRLRR